MQVGIVLLDTLDDTDRCGSRNIDHQHLIVAQRMNGFRLLYIARDLVLHHIDLN